MNKNDYIIRLERNNEHRKVESLVRESFWNVYRPGCYEHYVLNQLRNDPDFVKELDFVMEKDGKLIGQNIFMRAVIKTDDGRDLPIMTMGPICVSAMSLKGKDTVKFYWTIPWRKRQSLDAEHCALRVILISMEKAVLLMPATLEFVITVYLKARIRHSFCARSLSQIISMEFQENILRRKDILLMSLSLKNLINSFRIKKNLFFLDSFSD